MKKRLFVCFCILALLTGCARIPAVDPSAEPALPIAGAAVPSTPAAAPESTEPAATEPGEPGYSAGGTPTAGGVLVWTDPSAYRPYSGSEAKYTRLREGPLDQFEPSDDYGAVYPYAAARAFENLEYGGARSIGYRYGFVDRSGRILTDGIYSDAYPMSGYSEGYRNTVGRQPFWIVRQMKGYTVETREYEDFTDSWVNADFRCGVVSMDGSFATDCEYFRIVVFEKGFACVEEALGPFTVYDETGKRLFDSEKILGDLEPVYYGLEYGDGLYLVQLTLRTGKEYRYEERHCFYNADGEQVLGPYKDAGPFREGLACVSVDGERYGYIDKTGAWVIEPDYSENNCFQGGLAAQQTLDGRGVLLDARGDRVLDLPEGWSIRSDGFGYTAYEDEAGDYLPHYYDRSGKALDVGGTARTDRLDEDSFWEYDEALERARVWRLTTGEEITVDCPSWFETGIAERDGELYFGYIGHCYREGMESFFLRRDLSEAWSLEKPGQAVSNSHSSTVDPCTGETWYLCRTAAGWAGLTESGKRMTLPLHSEAPEIWGDMVCAVTDRASCMATLEGEIVFLCPLDAED